MGNSFQTISPVDGSVYVERYFADEQEIERKLAKVKKSQKEWQATSITERVIICRKVVDYFLENIDALQEELTWQMGRPIQYAGFEISNGFRERAEHMIKIAEESLADIAVDEPSGFHRFIRKEPLGTVFVLAPWNYPYLTSVNAIIPAIMAGNTVILKHAQQTPLCAERYEKAFEFAGIPEGVFQILHLSHKQVANVIADKRIDFVAFTGSVNGGKAIQKAASQRFIATGLELGGKDPAYVRHDANLDYAIENLVDGSFFNSGQSCCGIERIYVDEKLFDAFVDGFVELTKKYKLGNPLDLETTIGPMVKTAAADFAKSQIENAIQKGAKALIDPKIFPNHQDESPYMAPQVLTNVNHEMEIMTEETFGPVVGIMAVKGDEEAIKLMNDSKYGLTASIWSENVEESLGIGNQIETGTLFMNRCDYLDPALAWTGVKDSGRGCTLSALGYDALTRPKSFHLKLRTQ